MRKAIAAGALCVALAAGAVCAGCSSGTTVEIFDGETYTLEGSDGVETTYYALDEDDVKALAGTEVEATAVSVETSGEATYFDEDGNEDGTYDCCFLEFEFDYTTDDGEYPVDMADSWDLGEVEGYDTALEYADSVVAVTYADGSEASIGDIAEGDSLTVVMDKESRLTSIVINE